MVELPEPDGWGEITFPDGAVILPPLNRPVCDRDAKWVAGLPGATLGGEGKKAYHDTPEAAAAWLASRGYGPGANRGEG